MPRLTCRAPLESGLKLDLNDLVRGGLIIEPGATNRHKNTWTDDYGEEIVSAMITTEATGPDDMWFPNEAWCHVQIGSFKERIILVSRPRHFGGHQWYFICPGTGRRVSVLWRPTGERGFACRQHWGRLYRSQCSTWIQRAHEGKARIKSKLCSIGGFDPDEWEFPPKPKWMRCRTYDRAEEQFNRYQAKLYGGLARAAAKFRYR